MLSSFPQIVAGVLVFLAGVSVRQQQLQTSFPPQTEESRKFVYSESSELAWSLASHAPPPQNSSRKPPPALYFRYSAHSGFGNQLISLLRAVELATQTGRILLLPPILHDGANATNGLAYGGTGGQCKGDVVSEKNWATLAVENYWRTGDREVGWADVFDFGAVGRGGSENAGKNAARGTTGDRSGHSSADSTKTKVLLTEDSSLANRKRIIQSRPLQFLPPPGRLEVFGDLCGKSDSELFHWSQSFDQGQGHQDIWAGTLFPRVSSLGEGRKGDWLFEDWAGGDHSGKRTAATKWDHGEHCLSPPLRTLPLREEWALREGEAPDVCIHYRGGDLVSLFPEVEQAQRQHLRTWLDGQSGSKTAPLRGKKVLLISDSLGDLLKLPEIRRLCVSWRAGSGSATSTTTNATTTSTSGSAVGGADTTSNLGATCLGGGGSLPFVLQKHNRAPGFVKDWVRCLLSREFVYLERTRSTFQATLRRAHDCRRGNSTMITVKGEG